MTPAKLKKNKRKHALNKGGVFFLFLLSNSHSSELFPCVADDSCDKEGMHCDVHVMDIEDSESESQQT